MAPSRRSGPSNDENPDIAAIIAQQLQTILPQIVTQVTNNVNNANANGGNGGNGGNNGCSYKTFLACNPQDYDGKGGAVALTRWIEKMEYVIENSGCAENQKVKYVASSFINKALTWWNTQVQARGSEAAIGYTDRFHELAKLVPHLSAILKAGILTDVEVRCDTLTRSSEKRMEVAPVSAVRMENNQRVCYECGRSDHLRNTCPKLNQALGQAGNRLALEGNRNTRNNGNQARGRAFSMNAVDALQDPNVVTGTFFLNDHFATVLFDYGADFSFISTKFAPLLNVKPGIVSPGYIIEVANGKKEEFDRIIRDYKLELGNSLFTIDLIPLGHGSFDVIVGMDWLSKNKAEIVCHEKVVRIPLESGEILRVQGERTLGGTKTLMSTKAEEPKLSDIPYYLIPRAMPVAKSPYRLAPSEMQELFEQLQELQDKTKEDHEVHLKLVLELLKKERLYANKIEAAKNWKAPTTPSEIRSFFRLARHYLYGTKSVIYTDHKSLQHIFDQKELNMRQRRWIELFIDYECEIRYHPG
ncbi:putative reverse transcriptase domain-containing protein [Tanacetum coccineum]